MTGQTHRARRGRPHALGRSCLAKGATLKVTFHGVRGSFPSPSRTAQRYGGHTSSVVVEVDGQSPLLLDLGTGISSALLPHASTGEAFGGTALVTHLHYDHVLGLPFFPPVNHPGGRLEIFGPRQPHGLLADAFAALVRPPYFPIHLRDLRGDICFQDLSAESFSVGAFRVTSRLVPHVGPTLGYRIESDGKVLCYVSDHQASADLHSVADSVLELCDGADLLIHDAQYTASEFRAKPDWGHSTAEYALHVAHEAGVKRLCLYHHDPSHDDDDVDRMLEAVRAPADAAGIDVLAAAESLAVTL
jgi:ribonuclease BN (tRNA processing enzyme)